MGMDPDSRRSGESGVCDEDTDRMQFDEGKAVADRLDELDEGETESFDDVFAEFDERFSPE